MLNLVLASTSVYRRQLMERLGIPFSAVAPRCDEEALKKGKGTSSAQELAEFLAHAKADSLRAEASGATIVGSDQLVAFGGGVLGKPGSAQEAVRQLRSLSGRTHELITAMVVIHGSQVWTHTDITRLTMRELSAKQCERYVEADRPLDCAGSYKLESRGIALFGAIESKDHSAITGLPLLALTKILAQIGYEIP